MRKTIYTFAFLFCALIGYSQNALPGKMVRFYWELSGSWSTYSDTTEYMYNASGKTTTKLFTMVSGYKIKTNYVYDSTGKLTARYKFNWENNRWDSAEYALYTYNDKGNVIASESYSFFGGVKKLNWRYKLTHIYASDNKVTETVEESWFEHLGDYRNDNKTIYAYNAQGAPSMVTVMEWDTVSNVFINDSRLSDLDWQKWNGSINDVDDETGNGSQLKSYKRLFWNGNTFQQNGRYTATYDSKSNPTEQKEEDLVVATWEVSDASRYTMTYDNDKMTQRIVETWEMGSGYINSKKEVYSDFVTPTSVKSIATNLQVKVYPNPASNYLIIEGKNNSMMRMTINDLQGRVVYDNKSVNANERVDLNALKTGAYYYTITNETGESAIGKLIIW
jgi:hypothetical protein